MVSNKSCLSFNKSNIPRTTPRTSSVTSPTTKCHRKLHNSTFKRRHMFHDHIKSNPSQSVDTGQRTGGVQSRDAHSLLVTPRRIRRGIPSLFLRRLKSHRQADLTRLSLKSHHHRQNDP